MKTSIFIVLLGFAFLSSSCKRDYFCACTSLSLSGSEEDSTITFIINERKKEAISECQSFITVDSNFVTNCTILE